MDVVHIPTGCPCRSMPFGDGYLSTVSQPAGSAAYSFTSLPLCGFMFSIMRYKEHGVKQFAFEYMIESFTRVM